MKKESMLLDAVVGVVATIAFVGAAIAVTILRYGLPVLVIVLVLRWLDVLP